MLTRARNGKGRPLVDVIVVKFNVPSYEAETIHTVLENTNIPYHLQVYDNYPDDKNLSVVWNECIARSDAEYICLLNSDTNVYEGWLEKMLNVFYTHKKVGAVGPITNKCGTHQTGFCEPQRDARIVPCNTLSGLCLMFPKKIWEEVKGFNEEFHLYGEDSDFCERIKKAGYTLLTHYGVFIYHYGHKSMEAIEESGEKDIQEIRKDASDRFRSLWR